MHHASSVFKGTLIFLTMPASSILSRNPRWRSLQPLTQLLVQESLQEKVRRAQNEAEHELAQAAETDRGAQAASSLRRDLSAREGPNPLEDFDSQVTLTFSLPLCVVQAGNNVSIGCNAMKQSALLLLWAAHFELKAHLMSLIGMARFNRVEMTCGIRKQCKQTIVSLCSG